MAYNQPPYNPHFGNTPGQSVASPQMSPNIPAHNAAPSNQPGGAYSSPFDNFNNPGGAAFNAFSQAGLNPITQMGLSYGSGILGSQREIFQRSFIKNFSTLKYYYNVNNSYVINKLKLILFPLRHKFWKRSIHRQADTEGYLPPRDDINAPDLYIPTMAFISYVIIVGFVLGTTATFTPEELGVIASWGASLWLLEVVIIKFGFYLLNSLTVPVFDVVAYCGYKFVGAVLTIIGGLALGDWAYYGILLSTSIFMAIFMVRTLKLVFPEANAGPHQGTTRRNYFLLAIAVLQLLECYFLAYNVFKAPHVPANASNQVYAQPDSE
eukprot:TRINITY_DN6794_c0_g1_i1.p1 TRINITY_DN6794_c0_g1~~TRINITY_DN6794_c0_g1_i1.p1  ORF type:complete len:323 (-),score=35.47 TRINITY_DN6794_c0_g1_i1:40-1008(-)